MGTRPRRLQEMPRSQGGAALLVAMLILLAVSVLATSGLSSAVIGVQIAQGTQASQESFQLALGAIDYVLADLDNLPMTGALDTPVAVDLTDNPTLTADAGDSIAATATRVHDCIPPPRSRFAHSADQYSGFAHEVEASVDRNASRRGRIGMTQGHVLIGPKCQ